MVSAQEFRGTILGRITDVSGAVIPGATVSATNEDTNVRSAAVSQADGAYEIPFLIPSTYRVEVEIQGFHKHVQSGITVAVAQNVTLDVVLKVGRMSETVTVSADASLLDRANGALGQVIGKEMVEGMPLNGRMIFTLTQLATGVIWEVPDFGATGSSGLRPFDNNAGSAWSLNGGRPGTNEFLLDGAPNGARGRFNFAPPVDAVNEFKVQTNTYDAQYGRTGGGTVNMTLKSGSNEFHGQAWDFRRLDSWDANSALNKAQDPPEPRPYHSYNQWGALLTGPLIRDRTFFMATYEGHHELVPFPTQTSVPTAAERTGDFSQSYVDQVRPLIIYDPLTTRPDPNRPGRYIRDPFPGNKIPASRINPIALKTLSLYPLPTIPNQRLNNFVNSSNLGHYDYDSELLRIDHQISGASKMFATIYHNHRDELRSNNGLQGTYTDYGQWPQIRTNHGATVDFVHTIDPHSVLNVRAAYSRWVEAFYQSDVEAFDASQLGFASLPGRYLPHFKVEQFPEFGVANEGTGTVDNTISLQANLTRVFAHHTLKFGGEYRNIRSNPSTTGDQNGFFEFKRTQTRADPNNGDSVSGDAIASFLLGYPDNGKVGHGDARALQWQYPALFAQDDLRLTGRLTVNMGLRWDYESPVTERYNRMVRGFAFDQKSSLADKVKNAPGASECPACANLKGGLLFAGVGGTPRGLFEPDWSNLQPRLGFAFALTQRLVLRGGYGIYYQPSNQLGGQTGFFVDTPYFATDLSGRVGIPELAFNTFANPFPAGLLSPPGADAGLSTQLGQAITFDDPNRPLPSIRQWNMGFQRELTRNIILDVAYVGSYVQNLPATHGSNNPPDGGLLINELSAADLAKGSAYLQQQVPNPFAGLLPGSNRNFPTIQRQELLKPYPQFGAITENSVSVGRAWYNSLQVRIEKRLSSGLSLISAYTLSRSEEGTNFLNPQDPKPVRELARYDRTHRWVLSGIYHLPFGHGRRFAGEADGLKQLLIGGWDTHWIYTMQSGIPLPEPDLIPLASARLDHPTASRYFNTCYLTTSGRLTDCLPGEQPVWQQRASFTTRVAPNRFSDIRSPWKPFQLDASIAKEIKANKIRIQYRFEVFNAFNSVFPYAPITDYTSADFGKITKNGSSQFPRQIQMSLKVFF